MSKSTEKEGLQVNRALSTVNQSLFNIYYLGQTRVDRRCNSSMMPWIIEELKLKADEMKFIWLSPGKYGKVFWQKEGDICRGEGSIRGTNKVTPTQDPKHTLLATHPPHVSWCACLQGLKESALWQIMARSYSSIVMETSCTAA